MLCRLDTGADMTMVPAKTIAALKLQLVTEDIVLHDATGKVRKNQRMYRADIRIPGMPETHSVGVGETTKAIVYIGLDVLNDYVSEFHGPRQRFTLTAVSRGE